MFEIKRLTECTFEEALTAWNTGFEGYFSDMTMTHEMFLKRFPLEDLSPSLSIVAFVDGEPAGLILNGIRNLKGIKTAWNGGTGVASKFRKQGVGKAMMKESLSLYEQEGVQLAMLEAIEGNDKAIALYESLGYEIVDRLQYLELKGALKEPPFSPVSSFSIKKAYPAEIGQLPFYKTGNPWQTQWQSAKECEGAILTDDSGKEAGYAYFRKLFNEEGQHIATTLYQCEADERRDDSGDILKSLLTYVFESFTDEIRRIVLNLPLERSSLAHSVLKEIGFTPFVNQVMMNKKMVD